MSGIYELSCEACRVGAEPLTDTEIETFKSEIPNWELFEEDDMKRIRRQFNFDNFKQSIDFTNSVAKIAEENGHHPSILTEWGKVTVTYWSHKIRGLHKSDFIMAAKTDKIYGGQ